MAVGMPSMSNNFSGTKFNVTKSRLHCTNLYLFLIQGVGVAVGMPSMSNNFSGTCLIMASITLILGERIKYHMKALKKHQEHLERYHLQGD